MSYKAKNVDTDKMLEELNNMRDRAIKKHIQNEAVEDARFKQEMDDINRFERMFYCSNYEKAEQALKAQEE